MMVAVHDRRSSSIESLPCLKGIRGVRQPPSNSTVRQMKRRHTWSPARREKEGAA